MEQWASIRGLRAVSPELAVKRQFGAGDRPSLRDFFRGLPRSHVREETLAVLAAEWMEFAEGEEVSLEACFFGLVSGTVVFPPESLHQTEQPTSAPACVGAPDLLLGRKPRRCIARTHCTGWMVQKPAPSAAKDLVRALQEVRLAWLLEHIDPRWLERGRLERFPAHRKIVRAGEVSGMVHLLFQGEVSALVGTRTVETFSPGAWLGVSATPEPADLVASTAGAMFAFDRTLLTKLCPSAAALAEARREVASAALRPHLPAVDKTLRTTVPLTTSAFWPCADKGPKPQIPFKKPCGAENKEAMASLIDQW